MERALFRQFIKKEIIVRTLKLAFEGGDFETVVIEETFEFTLPEILKDVKGKEYVGVDLDGTQAYYDGWKGLEHIGEPIPRMVAYVKFLIANNIPVAHFTARVASIDENKVLIAKKAIDDWSLKVYGKALPVTAIKDKYMVAYYDDKAYNVKLNKGIWLPH